ncbi:hypothetical protein [Streptomyces longwoodensis]|uniref:hypothetical protein n=1 Tax=Streptomyces longwoodensis TaxID=68231 RepID=UPI002253DA98|nr:hypothetical protein [Streptomyces longwoodensis]MCX4993833.1 hypothetical protein [Streptomyces longwoodensis]MCX4998047.1 hypothetical protein [Streptomyces longwoodensis]
MNRLTRPAGRLADGSSALARRLAARAAAWVARGRRHDLTGWRAALGCWARLTVLAFGLYLLWRLVRAVPQLMWLATGAWTALAWRAGRPSREEPAEAPPAPDREAVRTLLLEVMGDAPAVHLRTVLAHLQKQDQWKGRTVGDLRAALEALGIPVHPKVKAPGGGPTRGVRRVDLAPAPDQDPQTSTEASTAA